MKFIKIPTPDGVIHVSEERLADPRVAAHWGYGQETKPAPVKAARKR